MDGISAETLFNSKTGYAYDDIIILPGFIDFAVSDVNLTSRLTKNKARLKRFDELAKKEFDSREDNLSIQIPVSKRLGTQVIDIKNLAKSYGDKLLFENVNFSFPPGLKVQATFSSHLQKNSPAKVHTSSRKYPKQIGGYIKIFLNY